MTTENVRVRGESAQDSTFQLSSAWQPICSATVHARPLTLVRGIAAHETKNGSSVVVLRRRQCTQPMRSRDSRNLANRNGTNITAQSIREDSGKGRACVNQRTPLTGDLVTRNHASYEGETGETQTGRRGRKRCRVRTSKLGWSYVSMDKSACKSESICGCKAAHEQQPERTCRLKGEGRQRCGSRDIGKKAHMGKSALDCQSEGACKRAGKHKPADKRNLGSARILMGEWRSQRTFMLVSMTHTPRLTYAGGQRCECKQERGHKLELVISKSVRECTRVDKHKSTCAHKLANKYKRGCAHKSTLVDGRIPAYACAPVCASWVEHMYKKTQVHEPALRVYKSTDVAKLARGRQQPCVYWPECEYRLTCGSKSANGWKLGYACKTVYTCRLENMRKFIYAHEPAGVCRPACGSKSASVRWLERASKSGDVAKPPRECESKCGPGCESRPACEHKPVHVSKPACNQKHVCCFEGEYKLSSVRTSAYGSKPMCVSKLANVSGLERVCKTTCTSHTSDVSKTDCMGKPVFTRRRAYAHRPVGAGGVEHEHKLTYAYKSTGRSTRKQAGAGGLGGVCRPTRMGRTASTHKPAGECMPGCDGWQKGK
eukprot:6197286-Pleurochrysis_carterae.AAC.3